MKFFKLLILFYIGVAVYLTMRWVGGGFNISEYTRGETFVFVIDTLVLIMFMIWVVRKIKDDT